MSDIDNEPQPAARVNDRRPFDPDGTERTPSGEPHVQPPVDPVLGAQEVEPPGLSAVEAEKLKLELDAARRRVNELATALQQLTKDREEFKQRITRERERMIDVEKGNVAQALLEAIDELDLSLDASGADNSPLAQGVRLIRNNLLAKIARTGVERLNVVGKVFDPNEAEAADMEVTTDPSQDQQVLTETRAGYRLNGRVIRPARVKVAKYIQPAQA